MFTGIVEELGSVKAFIKESRLIRLTINCAKILEDVRLGDSIAVNGICLTVAEKGTNWFTADVMPETLNRTGLGKLNISDCVNLERALKLSDRLGGHIVSGHIDGTGFVSEREEDENAIWLTIKASSDILRYITMKGSVALDGTSLTVAFVDEVCFKVSLIPLTARATTLGYRRVGDVINIECDMIGKYVEKLLTGTVQKQGTKKDITIDLLRENGFL